MHLRPQLSSIRARFGYPYHQWMTQEFDDAGWNLVQKSVQQKRTHDVTMLIEGPDGRFALMSKHSYPPGIFRSPSGGVKPGEDLVTGALREAKEETGLEIELKRFLLNITLDISHGNDVITWDSYVFYATTQDTKLRPTDLKEVKDTVWAGREHLQAMAVKLRETGNGGLIYRGNLTGASLWALDNPLLLREARPSDMAGITHSLLANRLPVENAQRTFWWIAEVQGLSSSTIGISLHNDCAELIGLTVDPLFRGKGVGHAMVEYVCDQWSDTIKRKRLGEKLRTPVLSDKLWLTTSMPGYFLPVNFVITDKNLLPATIQGQLTGLRAKWQGMRYQFYKL